MWSPEIGVCSWSLQTDNVPELVRLTRGVGAAVIHIGLGDPNHGSWREGAALAQALERSSLRMTATMIGFPGEDYTSPSTIRDTGGFGNPQTRASRLAIFANAVELTAKMGLTVLSGHAGFIPQGDGPARRGFLDCLESAASIAAARGVIFAMETGQETAKVLRRTLDELSCDNLKINFDPANMVTAGMGDPIEAISLLGADIVHVHAKDGLPPPAANTWGEETPLGEGDVGIGAFIDALNHAGYRGPLVIECETGDHKQKLEHIRRGVEYLRAIVDER